MKTIRHIFFAALFALASPACAEKLENADKLIRETVDKVLTAVRNKQLSEKEKIEHVMNVAEPVFDFPLMARLALGKTNWPKLSPKQQKEFTDLFVRQLRESYLGNVEMVADEKVLFEKPYYEKDKAHIMTRVITKEDPIQILYKLYTDKLSGKWRIYDVEIQGISIIRSYGMQYDQVLREGTPKTLLDKMNQRQERDKTEKTTPKTVKEQKKSK